MNKIFIHFFLILIPFLNFCAPPTKNVSEAIQSESKIIVVADHGAMNTSVLWMTNYTTHGFLGNEDRNHYACIYDLSTDDDTFVWALQPKNEKEKKLYPKKGLVDFLRYKHPNNPKQRTRYIRKRPLSLGGIRSTLQNDLGTAFINMNFDYVYIAQGVEVSPKQGFFSLLKQGSTVALLHAKDGWKSLAEAEKVRMLNAGVAAEEVAAFRIPWNKGLKYGKGRWVFGAFVASLLTNSLVYSNGLDTENRARAGTNLMINPDIASNNVKVWSPSAYTGIGAFRKAADLTSDKWFFHNRDVKCLPPELLADVIEHGEWDETQNPFHR